MKKNKDKGKFSIRQGNARCLGAVVEGGNVHFSVIAVPDAQCSLLLYKKGEQQVYEELEIPEAFSVGSVRSLCVEDIDPSLYEYNYKIGGKVKVDPYGRRIVRDYDYGEVVKEENDHTIRTAVDAGVYDWSGDETLDIPFEEALIYTVHPRGFTRQAQSKVRHKGTFLGIKEKIPYLKDLGINHLELMPVYDYDEFAREEEQETRYEPYKRPDDRRFNYWGYTKGNYFAPKQSYAAGADPAAELKDTIKALHQNGIAVILEFFFMEDTDSLLINACLTYWTEVYHVDGFHLTGTMTNVHTALGNPYLSKVKILGDYFDTSRITGGSWQSNRRRLAEYHDGFMVDVRRMLKGDEGQMDAFLHRMKYNPEKGGVVNYIANHNGFTLADACAYEEKHNEANGEENRDGTIYNYSWNCGEEGPTRKRKVNAVRRKQMKNAIACVLLSQGTPLIYGGDEFGNSQQGNNNAYCQDNEIGWVDWRYEKKNKDLLAFTKKLIEFRKAHQILHTQRELQGIDSRACGYPDLSYHGEKAWFGGFENTSRQVGMMYCGQYAKEDCFLYIAYNFHWNEHGFALPNIPADMEWYIAGDTSGGIEEGVYDVGEEKKLGSRKAILVAERTIVILIAK